ncbi:MAG: hypothetical protein V7K97_13855 [Nostoc sp.]|uniref:hypothetical protein n=1 Tax=Nostoc sp. TaxID=1180 RepID=UPI002FF5996F
MVQIHENCCKLHNQGGQDAIQYGSVKGRDAINRRLYKGLIIVKTAIYRVFVIYDLS